MPQRAVDPVIASSANIVADLAQLPEDQWFERKSGRIQPKKLAEAVVGLANAEGGTIAVGIHNGDADPPSVDRINDFRQVAHDFTSPPVRMLTEEYEIDGDRRLLILRVSPGDRVHETASGDCFLRVGDETKKLSFAQRLELEYDRGSAPFDGGPVDLPALSLSATRVEEYRATIGATTPERALTARNLLTPSGQVTTAAYLLFADHPQTLYPSAHVRVLRYSSITRGTGASLTLEDDSDTRCEGPLAEQIETATQVIERLVPRRRALGSSGRFEAQPIIPRDAWLEGLVNAVVHRSYSMAGDHVRVEVFPDRIEIASPGRFPGLVDPQNLHDVARHARNPRIARALADLGITQELGEGIRRIFHEQRARGLADPTFTQTQSGVRLVLSAADALPATTLAALPRGAIDTLAVLRRAARPLGTGQVEELAGIARPTAIRHLRALEQAGVVVWEGQSPRDPRAAWRIA